MKNLESSQGLDVDDLAVGLMTVAREGLVTDRLVRKSQSSPALARLLDLDLLGPPETPLIMRAGKLEEVLAGVLPRLGEGRLASVADVLLSISPEYRGQPWGQRRPKAAYMWNPDYGEVRHFDRQLKEIIQHFAVELVFYRAERLPRPEQWSIQKRKTDRPAARDHGGVPIFKTKYTRRTQSGDAQVRYVLRANYQGRWLTKYVGQADWEALSIMFYDIETRQKIEAIPVL